MDTLLFISLFVLVLSAKAQENPVTCSPINCANGSDLNIQFPFRLQEFQPKKCGVPGFELYCEQNKTIIHFPSYGDLVIKFISYDLKKLQLLDPGNCVHEVFLNLNLSHTPFSYYYFLKEYQYLNCSAQLSASFIQVPCLSGLGHHVYIVETSFVMPEFCDHVKNVRIPFSYSPFLSDNTFGLGLTWNLANFQENVTELTAYSVQEKAWHHTGFIELADYKFLSCIMFIFMVVMVFVKKVSHAKKLDVEKEVEGYKELHTDEFIGDYEALKPKRECMGSVEVLVHN